MNTPTKMNPTPKYQIGQTVILIRPKCKVMKMIGRIIELKITTDKILYKISGSPFYHEEGYIASSKQELYELFQMEILPNLTIDYLKRFKESDYLFDPTDITKNDVISFLGK